MKITEMKTNDEMISWSIQYYDKLTEQWSPYLFLGKYAYCNREETLKDSIDLLNSTNTAFRLFEHKVRRIS